MVGVLVAIEVTRVSDVDVGALLDEVRELGDKLVGE